MLLQSLARSGRAMSSVRGRRIGRALGQVAMRPHIDSLQEVASTWISCHPNAGLPNEMGQFDLGPADMARIVGEFAERGWVNIVGGCCGTTPDHIRAIGESIRGLAPHK